MTDQQGSDFKIPDPMDITRTMADIAERSQRIVSGFIERQSSDGALGQHDPLNVGAAFMELTTKLMSDPAKMVNAQFSLWQGYMNLWQNTARRMMGEEAESIASVEDDRRVRDAAWEDNTLFDYIKQSYLLTSRWLQSTVSEVEGLDDKTAQKVDFYTRQFVDALSPSNFVMTNPEVLRATIESGGDNLLKGLSNLLEIGRASCRERV